MKTSLNFFSKLFLVSLILMSGSFFACAGESEKYYKPVEEKNIYKGTDGFAPNNFSGKTIIFDYTQSSLMHLDAVVKNPASKKEVRLQFKENTTETVNPADHEKKIQLIYSKLQPNVAIVAQKEESMRDKTEQYVLMFTSPTAGVAQCTVLGSHLERIIVNIRFRVE